MKVLNIWLWHLNHLKWDKQAVVSSLTYYSLFSPSGTHHTQSHRDWNRRCRCSTSGGGITIDWSETNKELSHLSHTIVFSPLQTLTTLDLASNEIGDEGAQHLAEALKSNKVRQTRKCLISYKLLSFLHFRHSPHSMWVGMESALKVLSISLRHYHRIKWGKQRVVSPLTYYCLFSPSDTHHTRSQPQWNRRWGCSTSGSSIRIE